MKHDHGEQHRELGKRDALIDRVMARGRRRPHALLDNGQRCRAGRARTQEGIAKSLAIGRVKVARRSGRARRGDSARGYGSGREPRCRTMANGRPTFSCVAVAKLRAPEALKRMADDRLLCAGRKPGCASVRSPPDTGCSRSDRAPELLAVPLSTSDSGGGRVCKRGCRRSSDCIDPFRQSSLAGLAQKLLQALRVRRPGNLNQIFFFFSFLAVVTLTLDQGSTVRVSWTRAIDDLDRLLERACRVRFEDSQGSVGGTVISPPAGIERLK